MILTVLQDTYYGNKVSDWLISLAIIAGALILNKIIVLLNKHVIKKLTAKTNNRLDDILFQMLESPVLLGIVLTAIWFAAHRLSLGADIEKQIAFSYKILIVVNVTWFIARFANALIEEYWVKKVDENNHKVLDAHLVSMLKKTILIIIWSLGIVTALNNIGYPVKTILGALSIFGVAFALAAQDTIKNVFAGITIFFDRPFRIGDRIKVDKFDGFIEDIGIRSIRIRTLEKRLVTVPNYKMMDSFIENISEEPLRRVMMKLSLTYNTTPDKMNEAMTILRDMPNRISNVYEKDVLVAFTDFTEFALAITFIYFIRKDADVMETPSQVNTEILRAFNASGLQFAFPTQTVYIGKE